LHFLCVLSIAIHPAHCSFSGNPQTQLSLQRLKNDVLSCANVSESLMHVVTPSVLSKSLEINIRPNIHLQIVKKFLLSFQYLLPSTTTFETNLFSLSQQFPLRNKSKNKCAIEYREPYYLKVPPWKIPTKGKLKPPLDRGGLTNIVTTAMKIKST
jgi:hypothetical protein